MIRTAFLLALAISLTAIDGVAQIQTVRPVAPRKRPPSGVVTTTPAASGPSSSFLPPGANDDCNSPTVLSGTGTFAFDASSATTGTQGQNNAICNQNGLPDIWNDVWFSWTATCTGMVTVETCGLVAWDSKIAVYGQSGCPSSPAIACNDDTCGAASQVIFPSVAGNVYTIQIGVYPGAIPGPGSFSIQCSGGAVNDPCATPTLLVGPGPHAIDTTPATTGSEGQANAACSALGLPAIERDLWYTWTSPDRGIVTVNFCAGGGTLDSKIAVYRGSGCPSGAAIACNDDSECGTRSIVCFDAQDGESFTFQIGSSPGTPAGTASFTISVSTPDVLRCGLDDGSTETTAGYAPSGGIVWMQRFGTPGEVSTVHSISTAFGSLLNPGFSVPNGTAAKIAIWDDPDDDGDPSNALLLAQKDIVVSAVDTDELVANRLDLPISVGGYYFIGVGVANGLNQYPAPFDIHACAAAGRAWVFGDASGAPNYANPAANDTPPSPVEVAFGLSGAWLLRPDCGLPEEPCETLLTAADAAFPNGNWISQVIVGSPADATGSQHVSPGGLNAYRRIDHTTSAFTAAVALLTGDNITPAIDGSVQSIDASFEVRASASGGLVLLVLRQGGVWFGAHPVTTGVGNWEHYGFQGLTSADFGDVLGGSATIDFSCTASPIQIGFLTYNGGGNPVTFDVDDFRVDFHGLECTTPCCDEEAVVDSQGNPVYPPGIGEIPPSEEIDEDRGDVKDIYGTQVTNTIDWVQNIGCPPSLGGTVPPGASSPNLAGSLASLGITGITPEKLQQLVLEWESNIANTELGYTNSLPTAGSVTGGGAYVAPVTPHISDASHCYAFGGRDIVYVHDIRFEAIVDGMVNSCAANSHWVEPTGSLGASTANPEYYGNGYFKQAAEHAWSAHIQKFFAQAAPNGIKNRYLIVCYSSNDRADVAAKAILAQIGDAMRFGTGVVDPSGNGDITKFGTSSFVTISQGLGSLVTDIAMSAAVMHPNLDAGFIASHCKAHIALHGAFKGTRYATALIAAWGYCLVSDPGTALAICAAIQLTQALAEDIGLGCAPDLSLACYISGPIVQNTALLDMVPLVVESKWTTYLNSVPVPTVTVSGAHPTLLAPLKNVLASGFDDGFINSDSQCAQKNLVVLWPSLLEVKNEGINVPPIIYSRLFDMGMVKDGMPIRATGFYLDQVIDRLVVTTGLGTLISILLPMDVASAATPFYSPVGMLENIPPSSQYNPRTQPAFFAALNRHAKHYSFIQSAADHFTGTNGRILPFMPFNQYWPSFGTEPNFEETFVIVDPEMFQTYSTSGYAGDDAPLVRAQDLPSIHERVRGKKIYVPYIQHWKLKWRPKWLWKRTYHLPVDTLQKHQCDYVYGCLLKGDSTPCGQTGLAFCPCDNNNGPCYPFVPNSAPIRGCRNSLPGNTGGLLDATGVADRSADAAGQNQVFLNASSITTSSCLFFQGTTRVNNGLGTPFGDGLRCVGGNIVRLKVVAATFGGFATYPGPGDLPLSQKGFIPLAGGTFHYQAWYRNGATYCTTDTFNLTNGYTIHWGP
jgi:hypothetical protein